MCIYTIFEIVYQRRRAACSYLKNLFLNLLAGLILNVSIAWLMSLAATFSPTEFYTISGIRDHALVRMRGVGADRFIWTRTHDHNSFPDCDGSTLPLWSRSLAKQTDAGGEPVAKAIEAFGIPMRSMRSSIVRENAQYNMLDSRGEYYHGLVPYVSGNTQMILSKPLGLPMHPILIGTVANSIVYGVFIYTIIRLSRAWQSIRRSRKGRCVQCGYDLVGIADAACPECGRPTRRGATVCGRRG